MVRWWLLIVVCSLSAKAQVLYPYRTCNSPKALKEFSGLALTGKNQLAAVNDGGNAPAVYFMDTTGKLLRTRVFHGISNVDWEELFYHDGYLYIADVGDNLCQRKGLNVYVYDMAKDTVMKRVPFDFADKSRGNISDKNKHYDCEAGFFDHEKFCFFSKTHAVPYTGISYQYLVDPQDKNKTCTASDSAYFGNKGFIYNSLTGAAISPSGNRVVFISCTRLWMKVFPQPGIYLGSGWEMEFVFDGFTQKESVTFLNEEHLVVADETTLGFMGGRMYFYDIGSFFNGNKRYARPSVQNAVLRRKNGNRYDFGFESLEPLGHITLFWVNEKGEILDKQEMDLTDNKINGEVVFRHTSKTPVAYWIASENKILFTSKIIRK